jgi:metallophosphoesterase (TIGR00282 family)
VSELRILFLGDVFGEPGRRAVRRLVPGLIQEKKIDLVLANVENMANGRGVTAKLVEEMQAAGVDFMTSGNHIFHVENSFAFLSSKDCPVLRPCNYPSHAPGRGVGIVTSKSGVRVGVINIMGRIFMENTLSLPFDAVDEALRSLSGDTDITVVDIHAETTSEKRALGWYLDGRAQLIVGTHTHVQTADEEIMPKGAAFITDLGMCGPYDSVIGMEKEPVIRKMRTALFSKFEVAQKDIRLCGVICDIDVTAKRALKIERVQIRMPESFTS